MATVRDKFESAVNQLINDKTYLVAISHLITKLPANNIPTMCVTFEKMRFYMFYNEKFVESLEFEELKAVIFHEFMHIMLNHMQRYKKYYDAGINPKILNIACDAAINQYLKYMPAWSIFPASFGAPEGHTFEQYVDFIINKFYDNVKQITKIKMSGGSGGQSDGDSEDSD